MRENMGLYRGKRIDNGEWVEGCLLHDSEQNESFIAEHFEDRAAYIREVIPETVGQYTGLTDKNGKKIFEGDIIVIGNCREHPVLVKFIEFSWQCVIPNDNVYIDYRHRLENNNTRYEVISNIHDNPELLKGGAE